MIDDKKAITVLSAGEQAVFDEIYRENCQIIVKHIEKRVSDAHKAEDYAADTFMRLSAHISEFIPLDKTERLKLLYSYANSITSEHERKISARNTYSFADIDQPDEYEDAGSFADCIDSGEDIQSELADKELTKALMREIDSLEPRKRQAILMRYGREMKTSEIAMKLNMNHSTLRRMLQNTLAELRRKLEGYRG